MSKCPQKSQLGSSSSSTLSHFFQLFRAGLFDRICMTKKRSTIGFNTVDPPPWWIVSLSISTNQSHLSFTHSWQYCRQGGEIQWTPFWASAREVYSSCPQPVRSIPDETVKTRSKDCLRPGCQNTFRWVFCFSILCHRRTDNARIIKAKMNMAPLFLAIFHMGKKSGAKPDERVPSRPGLFRLQTSAAVGPHTFYSHLPCPLLPGRLLYKVCGPKAADVCRQVLGQSLGGIRYRHLVSSWQAQGVIGLGQNGHGLRMEHPATQVKFTSCCGYYSCTKQYWLPCLAMFAMPFCLSMTHPSSPWVWSKPHFLQLPACL